MKRLLVSVLALLFIWPALAQDEKRAVALMPFQSTSPDKKATTAQLQDMVLKALSAKPTVDLVDRSKDKIVITELDNQIRDVSVAAKGMAAQGKLRGAREIMVGTVTEASAEAVDEDGNPIKKEDSPTSSSSNKNKTNSANKGGGGSGTGEGKDKEPANAKYTGVVTFSLQLIEVETGLVIEQANFTGNTLTTDAANKTTKGLAAILRKKTALIPATTASQMIMPDTKEKALLAALKSSEKEIIDWINKVYAPPMQIISVEERSKGLPETVLVTGLDAGIKKGTTILVHEIVFLDAGAGKKVRQEKKVGVLKVQEMQGEVTLCKVTDGEKELEEKIKGKNKIQLSIK